MPVIATWVCCLAAALILLLAPACVLADDDHERERGKHASGHAGEGGKHSLPAVSNAVYGRECGGCHFAYQPGLLPARSWQRLVASLPGHFGEEVSLSAEDKREIGRYLAANAADRSSARLTGKIIESLGGATPLRITELPYIRHKHEEDVSPAVLKRPSIGGSLANCAACHTGAARGVYDEDTVRIPN